jgi:hypothetical protein
MSINKNTVVNVGTSDIVAIAANLSRKSLLIQNKHSSQTLKVKFGAAVVASDVTQVQTLTFGSTPSSGSLVLRWNGANTAAIVSTDAAADVQTKIQAVSGLGSVTVTGSFVLGFVITMTAVTPQTFATDPQLAIFSNSMNATANIAVTTPGQYADGYFVAASNASLVFSGDSTPVDAVHIVASGSGTRVELVEGVV